MTKKVQTITEIKCDLCNWKTDLEGEFTSLTVRDASGDCPEVPPVLYRHVCNRCMPKLLGAWHTRCGAVKAPEWAKETT